MRDESGAKPTAVVADRLYAEAESGGSMSRRVGWLDQIRATTAGRITLKVVVAILGVAIALLGVVMIPLPGPGWLVVFAGLAILSIEYVWAKHLLHYAREKIRAWTHWVGRQTPVVRLTIGAIGLVFVGILLWVAVWQGVGREFVTQLWRFLTSH